MKKAVFMMGLSVILVSPMVLAEYEIYGKANVGIEQLETDTNGRKTSEGNLRSFASRIGIKGKQAIADQLDVIYQWEVEVDLTGDNAGANDLLKARNQFIGLKGDFGQVIAGIHDTPMKQAEGKIDLFSDIIDIARVQDKYMDTQEREKDFLGYYSPKFNGIQFQLATMPGKVNNASLGDAFSTALVYGDKKLKKSSFFAALAYDSDVDGSDANAIRISGSTKLGQMTLGAIIEQADNGSMNTDKQNRYVVSGKYKLANNNTLKLQYASSENADAVAGSTDITVGLSHQFAKTTHVYGLISSGENVGGLSGADSTSVIIGIVHKFKF